MTIQIGLDVLTTITRMTNHINSKFIELILTDFTMEFCILRKKDTVHHATSYSQERIMSSTAVPLFSKTVPKRLADKSATEFDIYLRCGLAPQKLLAITNFFRTNLISRKLKEKYFIET
uniref:Uncharacterized protein n=1 Tax=Romanomermis culicivorax TaxID=13658 RepID=A0A915IZC7_ROMCU